MREDGSTLRLASRLISWLRQLIPEIAKFGIVGSAAFVTADGGSNLLRFEAGLDPLTSNAIATSVAMVLAFVGNRYWTFRSRQRTGVRREGILFFIFNVGGLLIQLACISFTTYALGLTGKLPYNITLIVGIGAGTLFRFWSYRKWVWLASPGHGERVSSEARGTRVAATTEAAPAGKDGRRQRLPATVDKDRGQGRRARSISETPGSDLTGR